MEFKKAQRTKAKLRLALAGPSGSGKTFSSLLIAKGIGGKVAMIDTERGSGELYADNPKIGLDYDALQLGPPFSPQRYVQAIKAAVAAGYDVVIIDSGSHAWMGEGGMLDMVDKAAKANRNNSMAGWKAVKPHEQAFLEAITGEPIHIIMTLRTKTEWDMSKDERTGKVVPTKVGLKPEQRAGIEYEFTTVFDLTVDGNIATASKDRTDLFTGAHFIPTAETGQQLLAWLNGGAEAPTQPPAAPANQAPASQAPAPAAAPVEQAQPPSQQAPPDQSSPGQGQESPSPYPERAEMVTRGWNRVLRMAGGDNQAVARMRKKLSDIFQRDLTAANPLSELHDNEAQTAWDYIKEIYGPWKARKEAV